MANNSFDKFLDKYYEDIREIVKTLGDKPLDYDEIIEKVKQKYENKKPIATNNIINQKIKTMNVGQSNLKEATKYSQYYTYNVRLTDNLYSNKKDYIFKLDNSFFKKIFGKSYTRLSMNGVNVAYHNIIFNYKPKKSKMMIDDTYVSFEPFQITVSTEGCHELIYYHTPNNGQNVEVLKVIHILNIDMVIDKMKEILDDTYISEKGKTNMVTSLIKHLGDRQAPERYGVDDYEEFAGMSEDQAIMIIDDYEDEELLDSLVEYLI